MNRKVSLILTANEMGSTKVVVLYKLFCVVVILHLCGSHHSELFPKIGVLGVQKCHQELLEIEENFLKNTGEGLIFSKVADF